MTETVSLNRPPRRPWAYFLTAACYGAHLHGHPEGSVDRDHCAWRGPRIEPSPAFRDYERAQLKEPPFVMDAPRRTAVLEAMLAVCEHQNWTAHAAHVRTNHFHMVVTAEKDPAAALGKLKAYASRALNERFGQRQRHWARQGSTRWLWSPNDVNDTVDYVLKRQGAPMAVYENLARWQDFLNRRT